MNNLGVMYDFGRGAPKDWTEAAKWYREAAEQGNAPAQANLGVLYLDGRGVTNDLVQAYVWFKLSARHGNGIGRKYLMDYEDNQLLKTNQLAQADRIIEAYQDHIAQKNAQKL